MVSLAVFWLSISARGTFNLYLCSAVLYFLRTVWWSISVLWGIRPQLEVTKIDSMFYAEKILEIRGEEQN